MSSTRSFFCLPAVLATLVSLAAGCASSAAAPDGEGASSSAATVAVATLSFDAAWNETLGGSVAAGGAFVIDYDAARLPNCRASHNGNPGWQITVYTQFAPGGETVASEIFAHAAKPSGEPDYYSWVHQLPKVQIPVGATSFSMWANNTSGFDHPCSEWDSNYGKNYTFTLSGSPPPPATVSFEREWSTAQSGTIRRGNPLTIAYARARMDALTQAGTVKYHCYGYGCCSYDSNVRAHVRFQSTGAFAAYPLQDDSVVVDVPTDAARVEVYFDADVVTTTWYCGSSGPKYTQPAPDRFYDSNYGSNFVLAIP